MKIKDVEFNVIGAASLSYFWVKTYLLTVRALYHDGSIETAAFAFAAATFLTISHVLVWRSAKLFRDFAQSVVILDGMLKLLVKCQARIQHLEAKNHDKKTG